MCLKLNVRHAKLVRIENNAKGKLVWSPDTSRTRMICQKARKNTMTSPMGVLPESVSSKRKPRWRHFYRDLKLEGRRIKLEMRLKGRSLRPN